MVHILYDFERVAETLDYYEFNTHIKDGTPEGYHLDNRGLKLTLRWEDKVFYARLTDPHNDNKILSDLRDDSLIGLVRRIDKALDKRQDYNPLITT